MIGKKKKAEPKKKVVKPDLRYVGGYDLKWLDQLGDEHPDYAKHKEDIKKYKESLKE